MQPSVFPTQSIGGAGGRSVIGASFARTQGVPAASSSTNAGVESDSWIEVPSHPSDSQYTSSSDDHIITAGLRVFQTRRRRRGTARPTTHPNEPLEPDSSSEEDDDEGEGKDMGSLIHSMTMSSDDYSSPDDDDGESDDEASASDSNGRARTVFSSSVPTQQHPAPPGGNRSHAYTGFNSFAPNRAADHDAALRASLSTLLSCAAAARGLPKSSQSQTLQASQPQHQQQGGRVAVDSLTLVREGGEPSNSAIKPRSLSITSTSTTSTSRSPSSEQLAKKDSKKSKRSSTKSSLKPKRRSRSSTRESNENEITSLSSISYMTLAISAGAIVALSAITFSAGYALGKEVGKGEGSILGSVGRGEGGRAALKGTSKSIGVGTRFTTIAAF